MLKGQTLTRSPFGKAAATPAPPWHYSSDIVGAEYWTDPAATAALLPDGLSPDPKTNGHVTAVFLDWQFTSQNEELLDPARYQYREAFVLIDAVWRETLVAFCPYIYVDNDAAMARGWTQGFPKRLGSVFQTRSFTAPGLAAGQLQPGSRFGASLSAHGERLMEARITLHQAEPDPRVIFGRPTVNLRHFPRLAAGQQDGPAVNELVLSITGNLTIVDMWTGEADLLIPEIEGEELYALSPMSMGKGFRCSMAYSVTDVRTLEDFQA